MNLEKKLFMHAVGHFDAAFRIPHMTKVNKTNDMMLGFRLAATLEGIEIHFLAV
ncbi:hypothetical protein Bcer98_0645 [Bacillus cytotoxicus NVH 391-98]|uniref:Uncharacterized protein n=1 Tax=Bacillus cytotoxicus (strain DSM 22905 / CIP 110041 / 391-98 / NVH 391-98) TaxID=315749 RepID=A7GLI4_BACCN|nr:hypothetical protein Bcer98_0645 [Bacillus cytotoxicus NVH 391-98]